MRTICDVAWELGARTDLRARMVRLGLAVAMTLVWSLGPILPGARAGEVPGAQREPTLDDLKQLAEKLDRVCGELETAEQKSPRDSFDPRALSLKLGKEPKAHFEWVRDNTSWVPYRGALRGSAGVLIDRIGNSLDRALLLAELLASAGFKVRLAGGEIPEAAAGEAIARLRPAVARPRPEKVAKIAPASQSADTLARELGIDPAKVRVSSAQFTLKAEMLAEEVGQRVAEQSRRLAKAVGAPAAPAADRPGSESESAARLAAVRDHWWVQMEDGQAWVDLDPLLPDARPGQTLVAARETILPDAASAKLLLGAPQCQEIEVRVVVERWSDGKTSEQTALRRMLRPWEAPFQSLRLDHVPVHWPKDLDPMREKDMAGRIKVAAEAETEWIPVLSAGAERYVNSSFTDSGDVREGAAERARSALDLAAGGDRVKDILGAGRIGAKAPPKDEKRSDSALLTAEWIEFEVRVPGAAPRTIRRQVFDLLGPAARAAGSAARPAIDAEKRLDRGLNLLGGTELLLQSSRPSTALFESIARGDLLASRAGLIQILKTAGTAKPSELNAQAAKVRHPPGRLLALCGLRHSLSRFQGETYLDRPNLLAFHSYLKRDPERKVIGCEAFDIILNEVAILPGGAVDPFSLRLELGVLDTNAEAALVGKCGRPRNLAQAYAADPGPGGEWLTIRERTDPAWAKIEASPDLRTRIEADLKAGYVVVVPPRPVGAGGRPQAGWWRVDPRTGQSLGMGEEGWGQAGVEDVAMSIIVLSVLVGIAQFVFCGGASPNSGLALRGGCLACGLLSSILFGMLLTAALGDPPAAPVLLDIILALLMELGCGYIGSDYFPR